MAIVAYKKASHKPSTVLFDSHFPDGSFDRSQSYYVGDAAGREGDWSAVDRDFASNIGVKFLVPEEVFKVDDVGHAQGQGQGQGKDKAQGTLGKAMPLKGQQVVVMVGYPASGKSTWIRNNLNSEQFQRIDGDSLKTQPKMIKEGERIIGLGGSPVFDATHGTVEKRAKIIEWARKHGLPVTCVWLTAPIDVAMDFNNERGHQGGPRVPAIAFYAFRKRFEPPTAAEGAELVTV